MVVAPRRAELVTTELGALAPGQLRIRVVGCGVCGSNLPVWEGRPWFDYPLTPGSPGHEGWGRVEQASSGADGWAEGTPVAFLHDSSFCEVVDVPASAAVMLPDALGDRPFPGEALGCAMNVAARSGFSPGATVAVVGTGFLGCVVAGLAAHAGARVLAISRRRFSLEMAATMGAHELVEGTDADAALRRVEELTDGRLCDVVVEAVGAQQPLELASRLTRTRGRLVIAGFHQDGPRTVDLQLWNWRGIDVVNAHERDPAVRRRGIEAALEAVVSGHLDPSPLYTHRVALDRWGDAMEALVERPEGFLKALVLT